MSLSLISVDSSVRLQVVDLMDQEGRRTVADIVTAELLSVRFPALQVAVIALDRFGSIRIVSSTYEMCHLLSKTAHCNS